MTLDPKLAFEILMVLGLLAAYLICVAVQESRGRRRLVIVASTGFVGLAVAIVALAGRNGLLP